VLAERFPYESRDHAQKKQALQQKDNVWRLVVNVVYLSFIMVGVAWSPECAFGWLRILAVVLSRAVHLIGQENVEFIQARFED